MTKFCVFGCVIVSSLVLSSNNLFVFANAQSNFERMEEAAAMQVTRVPLFHSELGREDNKTEFLNKQKSVKTADTVTPKPSTKDDRLYFELPEWFKGINTSASTPATTTTPSTPARINTELVSYETSMELINNNNTITVNGEYDFR